MESQVNIQNSFFNQARKDRAKVVVYLANGTKLVGRIKSFDKFTVILESGNGDQMIFKHAISTVSAQRSFGNYMQMDKARNTDARGTSKTETAQGSSQSVRPSTNDGG
jgi:host factor-I protein